MTTQDERPIRQVEAIVPAISQQLSESSSEGSGGKEISNSVKRDSKLRLIGSPDDVDGVPNAPGVGDAPVPAPVPEPPSLIPQPPAPLSAAPPVLAEPGELAEYPLDMSTALALVSGNNPQVGFARWRIEEAYAQLEQAQVLWLPSIQAGVNYYRQDGNLQASGGEIVDVNRNSFQGGFGTSAIGAGMTQFPGLIARFHLVDAIFQPKIAERSAWARGHAANAVLNDQLLEASLAYLELLQAHQSLAIAEETLENSRELADLTTEFARTGAGLQADADRMETEVALRRNELVRARERAAIASAQLAQVISLDPAYQIIPVETNAVPIQLADASSPRQQLLATGLAHRPELQESQCLVAEACERLKREQYAPLVPSILLGLSYSGFGGGLGSAVDNVGGKTDFNAVAYWEVRNLGFGEAAARDAADARLEQAKFQQVRVMDQIAREIAEAQSQVQLRQQQIEIAQNAIAAARESFQRNMERIRQGQGLPIEVLQSVQALDAARREYLRAVIDYNAAQFRLQRALGWPVSDAGD